MRNLVRRNTMAFDDVPDRGQIELVWYELVHAVEVPAKSVDKALVFGVHSDGVVQISLELVLPDFPTVRRIISPSQRYISGYSCWSIVSALKIHGQICSYAC